MMISQNKYDRASDRGVYFLTLTFNKVKRRKNEHTINGFVYFISGAFGG
jgi:hypothetical protein